MKRVVVGLLIAAACCAAQAEELPKVGGANSPDPSPPPKLALETAEMSAGKFALKVPTGKFEAPKGGAANYTVPGPIVSFKGNDGVWRGHGYLETYPRLLKFTGTLSPWKENGPLGQTATLKYEFEGGKTYEVTVTTGAGVVTLAETSTLGPRNLWVFDCYYGGADGVQAAWTPASGFAVDATGKKHAFLYLPCFYDKPEATVNPAANKGKEADPYGVAVLSPDPAKKDLAGFFVTQLDQWKNADAMGIQLWQRRQLPSDPGSRHFLGPDTKSDSTPNPRTAGLMGKSLYEGHVTIELNLGIGTRYLKFAAPGKGVTKETLADEFKKAIGS